MGKEGFGILANQDGTGTQRSEQNVASRVRKGSKSHPEDPERCGARTPGITSSLGVCSKPPGTSTETATAITGSNVTNFPPAFPNPGPPRNETATHFSHNNHIAILT